MAAPALVALAHGSRDPRSAATIKALIDEVRAMRPDLKVEPAFLELSKPSFTTVVDRLVKAGHDEIVVVPLLLTDAYHAKVDVPSAIAAAPSSTQAKITDDVQAELTRSFASAEATAQHYPNYADQITAAARESFVDGQDWAYIAGIVAILLGATLVFFMFPKRDEEQRLLAEYQAIDSA